MPGFSYRRTGNFPAIGDDGNVYHVIEYTGFAERPSLTDGAPTEIAVRVEYMLATGGTVVRIGDGSELRIVHSGVRLRGAHRNP